MFLRNTRPTRFGFRWNSLLKPFSQNAHFDQIFFFFVVILTSIIEITDHTHLHPHTHICTFNAWSSSKTPEKPSHTHLYFHMFYNSQIYSRFRFTHAHTYQLYIKSGSTLFFFVLSKFLRWFSICQANIKWHPWFMHHRQYRNHCVYRKILAHISNYIHLCSAMGAPCCRYDHGNSLSRFNSYFQSTLFSHPEFVLRFFLVYIPLLRTMNVFISCGL